MNTIWDIVRKNDEHFDIFKNGALLHTTPEAWLERQLAPYGILEDDYQDALRQLRNGGKATVSIPPLGKFYQI